MKYSNFAALKDPVPLNFFNKLLMKLFALKQNKIGLSNAVMSSSYSKFFWLPLYILNIFSTQLMIKKQRLQGTVNENHLSVINPLYCENCCKKV